ncbi:MULTISPECIES: hypothetical protein [unclassified Variovorax]|uniref:hypothetical protein n=1 Tax=unclassified Variovorax TaxID=663243 RepID=UPI001BD5A748|nr:MULTISPECIES: hypothetical protein [unclassified Variovorax]
MSTQYDPYDFIRSLTFESAIKWRDLYGPKVHVDPKVEPFLRQRIYRYMPPEVEALRLLRDHTMRFDHPSVWSKKGDKFEGYVAKKLFGRGSPFERMAVYAKCFTFHYASEAFWRINKNRVRLDFTSLHDLILCLRDATLADGGGLPPKLFVGRVRYMQPEAIHDAIDDELSGPRASLSRYAAESILMKRIGFGHENEVRIFYVNDGAFDGDALDVKLPARPPVRGLALIDPYMRGGLALDKIKKDLAPYVNARRSAFNLDPDR